MNRTGIERAVMSLPQSWTGYRELADLLIARLLPDEDVLSFRDRCAIEAMAAMLSTENHGVGSKGVLASDSFLIADAMEAERQKRSQE